MLKNTFIMEETSLKSDKYRSFFNFFSKLNKKSINIFLIIISINEDVCFLKFLIFLKIYVLSI